MNVDQFLKKQAQAFDSELSDDVKQSEAVLPVITFAMEPGSGGACIAEKVAARLGFALYGKNILTSMAHRSDLKESVLEAIEKDRPSVIEDFLSSILPKKDYVYTGDYFEKLKETVTIVAMIGKAVIVGRGANFILPPEKRLSIRVVAPLDLRIKNVALWHKTTLREAEKRIVNRATKRKSFIRDHFRENIADVMKYDLVISTDRMDPDTCTEMVIGALKGAQVNKVFARKST